MATAVLPTFADVVAARARIASRLLPTPLVENPALDARVGGRVFLKAENLQRVGAFKFRGAYNRILAVDPARFPGGVVACSSGNHAQGVAAAATLLGLRSVIVMPADAPALKVKRTRAFGGEVFFYDRAREDREAIAARLCAERGADMVHPYDDPGVMAGQGTVGLEIAEQATARGVALDAVLTGASGGGLAAGLALALEGAMPSARLHTVEPEGFDDYARSLAAGEHRANESKAGSLCDALMANTPGKLTFAVGKRLFGPGVVVSEEEVKDAVRFAFEELKLVVEPGGAVGLAALLSGRFDARGKAVAVVLSGGNVDPETFAAILAGR